MKRVLIVGGGLSGCEAAWQLADREIGVHLLEMRPTQSTEAHRSGQLAEIVCSNSFKSTLPQTASGLLKAELEILGCRLLEAAKETAVPAGHALAVDRELFAKRVTETLEKNPRVIVERKRQDDLEVTCPAIIATGPLTTGEFLKTLETHCSRDHLYFYDAIAPSVEAESIDPSVGYHASRYDKGDADYLNIPLTQNEYDGLIGRIREAKLVEPHVFEQRKYFEACLPIEVMVERGDDTPRFGPLRPKGLPDPRTGLEPYAVIQLRQETQNGTLLGLVGFQTRMTYPAQESVIRSLPGFHRARILRYGSIHRNIFLNIPALCDPYQRDRKIEGLFYAGQICGVEGYVECIASGLITALTVFAGSCDRALPPIPKETMIGSLMNHIHTPSRNFQPMNANMGILPAPGRRKGNRTTRYRETAERAVAAMRRYRDANTWLFDLPR